MKDLALRTKSARVLKKGTYAGIAQLVEQRIRNAWVVGSNPILGSLYL